jgi:hypothetical protein
MPPNVLNQNVESVSGSPIVQKPMMASADDFGGLEIVIFTPRSAYEGVLMSEDRSWLDVALIYSKE